MTCQTCKVEKQLPAGMMGHRIVVEVVVPADTMGPLPRSKSGFQYVLVVQDLFTKWIECIPLRSATVRKIDDLFRKFIINRWGTPQVLLTDIGTESEFFGARISNSAPNDTPLSPPSQSRRESQPYFEDNDRVVCRQGSRPV